MATFQILADLEHQVAFIGVGGVGLGAARAVDVGRTLVVRFIAAFVGALEQDRGVLDLLGDGERSAHASVLAVIGGLGDTAPVPAFTDQVLRFERAQYQSAAKGTGADTAGIGAAHHIDRRERGKIEA